MENSFVSGAMVEGEVFQRREGAVEVVRSSQMLDITYFEVRVLPLGLYEKRFEGFWLEHPEGCKS